MKGTLLRTLLPELSPKKRMYEALLLTLVRKNSTYCAIDRDE
ncbi:DUF5592 family protein [Priestia megaterium]|nr:DUF5592 family protein [Priestia megaterium]